MKPRKNGNLNATALGHFQWCRGGNAEGAMVGNAGGALKPASLVAEAVSGRPNCHLRSV